MLKTLATENSWSGQLVLDAGDVFNDKFRLDESRRPAIEATAEFIVDRFNDTGVAALVLGDRDTVLGLEQLKKLHSRANFPFLTANLVGAKTGKPVFDERTIVRVDGVNVGLFGVTMPQAARPGPKGEPPPWRVDNPIAVANKQVRALKAEGVDLIVALAHLPKQQLETLAKEVPGITAVMGGNGVRMLNHPDRYNDTYVCEAHSKGKYLSVLTLHIWPEKGPKGVYADRYRGEGLQRDLQQKTARLASYERLLERKLEEEKARAESGETLPTKPGRARTIGRDYYQKQVITLRAEKAALELEIEGLVAPSLSDNYIDYELVAVRKAIEDEPAIGKAVATFRKKYPKAKPASLKPKPPGLFAPNGPKEGSARRPQR